MPLPIYFINLERDVERRRLLESQFQELSLPGSRLDAVWWDQLSPKEQAQLYSPQLNRQQFFKPLRNGEKGCYASHLKAWQALLDSSAQAMVILEDDVRILPGFTAALDQIEQLPASWDMIKLLSRPVEKIRAARPLIPGHQLIQYQRVPSWTAGYVVSRTGAEKLLRSRMPFGRPVDVDIRFWFENDLRVFGVYPSLLALDELSDISSIWTERETLTTAQRLHKFVMKVRLTLGNLLARQPHLP
ncbi:glycosyltransferase family 25 protein [Comamonas aquatica]|uniref:glycosyltransferase family 25 protein n=1 Tax=Comamonas aquatica TaxID=225991 RepID=UPI002449834C|nr:glycosyltransferase family 25 protein [Comamonas aquatica]MDH0382567.1 glycosyltransferase family 25 protein [Comamonas aquatica]MDH0430623.1 glycosyltransferase family 25 protein [Comamonas aquatica]MDH0941493.1 glycosyltransferase family 25 protein [Comamonas aquatica]